MSQWVTPGATYWAMVATDCHPPGSPWVTVLGSHYQVAVNPPAVPDFGGAVYTSRELAVAAQDGLAEGMAGKPLEIAQVDYQGRGFFKRHVEASEPPANETETAIKTDLGRPPPVVTGEDHSVGRGPRR